MNSSVVYRNKISKQNENGDIRKPLYLMARPKSWGEFQSNLSAFKSIQRPIKSREGEEEKNKRRSNDVSDTVKEKNSTYSSVVLRKKSPTSKNDRIRPVSENLVPTPTFETVTLISQKDPQTNDNKTNNTLTKKTKATDSLAQNRDFMHRNHESTIESKSSTTATDSHLTSFPHVKLPGFKRTTVYSGLRVKTSSKPDELCKDSLSPVQPDALRVVSTNNDSNSVKPNLNVDKVIENTNALKCESDDNMHIPVKVQNEAIETVSPEQQINNDSYLNQSDSSDSDLSSVIDTGFSSFGENGNSLHSNDISDLSCNYEDESNEKSTDKSVLVIPTTLKSCYLNVYDISSAGGKCSTIASRSSTASVSETLSESDSSIETLSVDGSHISNKSNSYALNIDGKADNVMTNTSVEKNSIEEGITDDKISSELVRKTNTCQVQTKDMTLKGWKDDSDSLALSNFETKENLFTDPTHGTWPRRKHRSKRKQSQAEADELLRRFRETTETFRTRFRNIYDETRRKVEEAMFNLRVAIAKNGYTSRYNDLKQPAKHIDQMQQ